MIDKAEGNPDRVEVETSQLIFKVSAWNQFIRIMCNCKLFPHKNSQGIFTSGEELVMTVLPILDFLPQVLNFYFLLLFVCPCLTQLYGRLKISKKLNLMNCFLFQPVKSLVSKETILKLLNIDFMKVNGDDCNSSIMDDFF